MWLRWSWVSSSKCYCCQAKDGIRDYKVTGVQTCALPISGSRRSRRRFSWHRHVLEAELHIHCLESSRQLPLRRRRLVVRFLRGVVPLEADRVVALVDRKSVG